MPWPLFDGTTTFPSVTNVAGTVGLYANGDQSHAFGTRLWVWTIPAPNALPTNFAAFSAVTGLRKADWNPSDTETREVSHLLSPYRVRELRASWGVPGTYDFEFNYTPARMAALTALLPGPHLIADGHKYVIVQDPDGSFHQLFGFFHPPKKVHDVASGDNVIQMKFQSCGLDVYAKSA